MAINTKVLEDFIENHPTQYIGKYRYHSGYRIDDHTYKCHYYMLDENFRQIDIFVEIHCDDEVTYTFSEALHEQEQIFIIKDALHRTLEKVKYDSVLHYSLYESYIETISKEHIFLLPIDYCNLLEYMKYHNGINQETMDQFYSMYIPCLKMLLEKKNYERFLDSVLFILKMILHEYEWDGTNMKYLDTEYQFHIYYVREIIRIVYQNIDKFYKNVPNQLFEIIETLCQNQRFCFMIMTDFGSLVLSHYQVTNSLINALADRLVLNDKDENRENVNLVFSYIYYIFTNNYEQYYEVVLKELRSVIQYILTFANHDLDLALGNALVKADGYEIILDLFNKDYNTFIFSCFPIDSFPKELRSRVRDELVTAVQFFAARMDNEKYRLSSFEQVANINRLLMDNFEEWYK